MDAQADLSLCWVHSHFAGFVMLRLILFVLPSHSSHVTQPLNVAVFGPFKEIYYSECQAYMKKYPGANITNYQTAELTNKPYLISAVRRTGIYPFDNKDIPDSEVVPPVIYGHAINDNENDQQEVDDENHHLEVDNENYQQEHSQTNEANTDTPEVQPSEYVFSEVTVNGLATNAKESAVSVFFERRMITKAVQPKRKRKFVTPFIAGSLLKKSNTEILKASAQKATDKQTSVEKTKVSPQKGEKNKAPKTAAKKKVKCQVKTQKKDNEPRPSTSGISNGGGPTDRLSQPSEDSEYVPETEEENKCCVCHRFEAEYLKDC